MHYKFIGRLFLAACLAFSLTGCSGGDASQKVWPLATASPEDTVTHLFAEKFAEEADRLSNGAICIEVYPSSTLGSDRELLESCADGDIPFVVQNTSPQVSFMGNSPFLTVPAYFPRLKLCARCSIIRSFSP